MGTRYSQSEPPTARYGAGLRLEAEAATAAAALMLLLEIAVSFATLELERRRAEEGLIAARVSNQRTSGRMACPPS